VLPLEGRGARSKLMLGYAFWDLRPGPNEQRLERKISPNQAPLRQRGTGFKNRTLVFGATLVFASMPAITATAGFGSANADAGSAAVVINYFGRIIPDGNGNLVWAPKGHIVITRGEDGNRALI